MPELELLTEGGAGLVISGTQRSEHERAASGLALAVCHHDLEWQAAAKERRRDRTPRLLTFALHEDFEIGCATASIVSTLRREQDGAGAHRRRHQPLHCHAIIRSAGHCGEVHVVCR